MGNHNWKRLLINGVSTTEDWLTGSKRQHKGIKVSHWLVLNGLKLGESIGWNWTCMTVSVFWVLCKKCFKDSILYGHIDVMFDLANFLCCHVIVKGACSLGILIWLSSSWTGRDRLQTNADASAKKDGNLRSNGGQYMGFFHGIIIFIMGLYTNNSG